MEQNKTKLITVCLHNVEGPINLGSTARLMANLGFHNLRFSGPLTGNEFDVRKFAVGAMSLVDNAGRFSALQDMIADSQIVIGFTPRTPWEDTKALPYDELGPTVRDALHHGNSVALLFGNEAHGLSNDDLTYCNYRVSLPTVPSFPSMNLSHAILAGLLPIRSQKGFMDEEKEGGLPSGSQLEDDGKPLPELAESAERQRLASKILDFMEIIDFLGQKPSEPTRNQIEAIWRGGNFTKRECNLLMALFNKACVRTRILTNEKKAE